MTINKEGRVLAVDGDILAYRTAAVCEDHFEGSCNSILASTLREIATDTGVHNMRIYISGHGNFRYRIGKTKPYKGNRATMVRPKFLEHCKQHLIREYGAILVNGYEADDAIATDMSKNNAIHCGIDKDMLQVEGDHYNYVKKEWRTVTPDEAKIILYRQILMGDTSDNIPGLPRVGEKKAEEIIFNHATAHEDAISFYREVCEAKLPDVDYLEYFAEQAALVTMIRNIDIWALLTTHVEPDTGGFEQQEGEDVPPVEAPAKVEPKL